MKFVTREIKDIGIDFLEIYTISDLHIGDGLWDEKATVKIIEKIEKNPYALVILNGDILNNATKGGVSDVYGQKLSPMEQIDRAKRLLLPIKDKIICINTGNHESRTYKNDGVDLTEVLAMELGLAHLYSPTGTLMFIRFGAIRKDKSRKLGVKQICYTIYATHGCGGGKTAGAKVNRLVQLAGIVDADCYIHSHTHLPASLKEAFYRTDTRNGKAYLVDKLFVNTNAFLGYGGYGETYGFKPASIAMPIIYLDGRQRLLNAFL
jgi:predicted phosphodiesterase